MKDRIEGACIEYGRRVVHIEKWREILKEEHMEDLNIGMNHSSFIHYSV